MRRWARASREMRCGSCGATLARGVAIQLLRVAGVTIEKTRGECCADSKPPVDLPALVMRPEIQPTRRMPPMLLPLVDWKARASGTREPGEDD